MSPEDADERELYIIGEGPYVDTGLWEMRVTPEEVAIVPKHFSWVGLVVINVIFSLLFGLFLYVGIRFGETSLLFLIPMVCGVALMTCGIINRVTVWSVRNAQRRGPWLIIDRVNHIVHLPRHDLSVPFSEIDHLQATTTHTYGAKLYPSRRHGTNGASRSELNLVLHDGDPPRRYAILSTSHNYELEKLARKLSGLTGLPAKRVRSDLFQQEKFSMPYKIRIFETWMTPPNKEQRTTN